MKIALKTGTLAIIGAAALLATTNLGLSQAAAPAAGAPAPAPAGQPPAPPARAPEMALALEAAQVAIASCTANGYKVGVSVVDSAGVLRLLISVDGAAKQAVESSTRKAYTANALKVSTADTQERVKTDTALAAKVTADPNLFARAGGLPLMVGNEVIGAIGVGGAPGGDKDEACAIAGLDKIKARLK